MALIFDIDNRNRFSIEIVAEKELLDKKDSLLFENILNSMNRIKKMHQEYLTRLGKIIGQNRIDYVAALDNLFTYLTILRRRIEEKYAEICDIESERESLRIPFVFNISRITAKGTLKSEDIINLNDFDELFKNMIVAKVKDLIVKYKDFSDPGKQNAEKISDLIKIFDRILYNILIIRHSIEYI